MAPAGNRFVAADWCGIFFLANVLRNSTVCQHDYSFSVDRDGTVSRLTYEVVDDSGEFVVEL